MLMSQLVNYSIIEAGLRALADKAHESAVAQAEGKPIPCGLSENDMELVDMLSEEPCYMMGSLCEKFFKVYD